MEWGNQNFFFNGCGVKINAKKYKRHLQKEFLPAIQRLYKHKNWIFTQDNALSHRSYLSSNIIEVIKAVLNFFICFTKRFHNYKKAQNAYKRTKIKNAPKKHLRGK